MQIEHVFQEISYSGSLPQGQEITVITQDSRRACPGAIFVCAKGMTTDGHDYAKAALEAGAACIVTERPMGLACEVTVKNGRKAYGELCSNFFGRPAQRMKLVAVTGTNGKSTVTTLIKQVLEQAGYKVGLLGTIHTEIDTMEVPAKYTTPEAWDLNALLARMYLANCTYAVMEASSQAMDQMRLWGLQFEVGVFTNLTQDHLDYHKTFENYYAAKKSLFAQVNTMIVNADDAYGKRLLAECAGVQKISVSTATGDADYAVENVQLSAAGVVFDAVAGQRRATVTFPMPGEYSVYNALLAGATAVALGVPFQKAFAALENTRGVRGRCEVLYHGAFTILCDYAHTGDAIEKMLCGIAPFTKGRLIVLYGCAGERDAQKRPLMAQSVARYADCIVLTSDNPRKEEPYAILEDSIPALRESGKQLIVEVERRRALRKALELLQEGDVLTLCGKGHEDYQVIDGVTIYLDEHRIVADWLREKGL